MSKTWEESLNHNLIFPQWFIDILKLCQNLWLVPPDHADEKWMLGEWLESRLPGTITPRSMDLNPEQQPSPSQWSSRSFLRWGWSETWRSTWTMCYINLYSSKCTRTPGYGRCQLMSRYQGSGAFSTWKIDFKNVCLPSTQVLISKCRFPIKATKILGEVADCMTGQRRCKMTLVPGSKRAHK